jgi:GalNAc-alpha-(1->4)-GalNAc-alpha-(1->3)-diNAcBac-PP-undecaprenol alpha-1,4-N-acetyl-D-galactosaminyltransferase
MSEDKKKICLIAPSLQMGGIERAMSTLANKFAEKGYQIHYVTLLPLDNFFKLDEAIIVYKPNYYFSRKMTIYEYLNFYINLFNPFGYIRKTVKYIQPDVVLSFCEAFPIVSIALTGIKIPYFISKRTSPIFKPGLINYIINCVAFILHRPKAAIMQTQTAAKMKEFYWGSSIVVIPNVARQIIEYKIEKKNNWILGIGRLHNEKGFDRLIISFSLLKNDDWELVIAGSGDELENLKKIAINNGVANRVHFLGRVENIDELLAKCKIFVLSSRREGFPNALCEAMAAGIPPISFDILAGPSDIIENGKNGFLVKDGDVVELSNKIDFLIKNEAIYQMISNEAKKIKDKYSIDEISQLYLNTLFN